MKLLNINGNILNYKIKREKRKTIRIKVLEEGYIEVSAPNRVEVSYVEKLIMENSTSLFEGLKKSEEIKIKRENLECLYLLGKKIKIIFRPKENLKSFAKLNEDELIVYCDDEASERYKLIKDWYRETAREILTERTKVYSAMIKVETNRIFIKEQKTRWGSCSSKKNINYNFRIVMAPMEIVDYLVVHELCHLIHLNHKKEFWDLVGTLIPNYKGRRQWIKMEGKKLIF